MANLLIEIGNTALKAAWAEGTTLGKTFRYQGEKVMEFILSVVEKEKADVMAVSSFNPLSAEEEGMLRAFCRHLMVFDKNHTETLLEAGFPEYLSYDRAASLMAVRFLFAGKPCTVFDFGTTLTVDFIDEDGRYGGGNVSPGCRTRFKALNRYSKSLPLVDTPEGEVGIGKTETGSIESGVISGIIFEIKGYTALHPQNVVIFTGGDAEYFAARMKSPVFTIGNLMLMGFALVTDDYVKKNFS